MTSTFTHALPEQRPVLARTPRVRPTTTTSIVVDDVTALYPIDQQDAGELFQRLDANRAHLRRWHPWVDIMRSTGDVEKGIAAWQMLMADRRGFFFGVRHANRLCGMLNHQTLDCANRWSALSFWLEAGHQGRGIMTAACRTLITHGFETLKLNRVTIECATQNERSRAIPERLGFRLEGVVRGIELLQGRFVDHAMYGLLRTEWPTGC
jgi:ribosomal-protein-serine acetyltransferase